MDVNPYAQFFCQLKDHSSFQNLEIRIASNAKLDQRVYNKPSVDQVATIWIDGNNPNVPFDREIIVHEHSGSHGIGVASLNQNISTFAFADEVLDNEQQGVR
ncbi:hypothetical protein P3S68_004237 [Capsicum galapagoense]